MRVLFVETGRRGGSVLRLLTLLQRLDRNRFHAGVLSMYRDEAAARLFELDGLFCQAHLGVSRENQPDIFRLPGGIPVPTPFALYFLARSLALMRRHRPDIAYINTGIDPNQPAIVAARWLGIPVVCHIRMTRPLPRHERPFVPWLARIVTLSRWAEAFYRDDLGVPAERVCTVYDGTDLTVFDRRYRESPDLRLPAGPLYVCLVGSLNERKRPDLALEAFRLASARCPGLRLVLAGDGLLRRELERRVSALGLQEAVIIPGTVRNVPALLRQCHIGLLVSEREGMPNAVQEYMAARLPVVMTALPGAEELVQHEASGLILSRSTPGDIADALVRLAGSAELRERFGTTGRRLVERDEFQVEREVRSIEALLLDLVSTRGKERMV